MKFVDEVIIDLSAGDGGAGASHFRREKFVPHGGPDGGDGGSGGSIIAEASHSKRTLLDFQFRPLWKANDGEPGAKNRKHGKNGEDIKLELPVGTEIYRLKDEEDGEGLLVADLVLDGDRVTLVKGGKGGRGNTHFKSATRQAPQYAQKGLPGDSAKFRLSLKLLADIGLVGLPNAGKSTFLSRVTEARPKIADYPFTTLEPQLGVVKGPGGSSCVIADIPGLIEGASDGKGLGLEFLKHIERTGVLAHLIDSSPVLQHEPSDPSPSLSLKSARLTIEDELNRYPGEISKKPMIYIFTKLDLLPPEWTLDKLRHLAEIGQDAEIFGISSATGKGIDDVLRCFFNMLNQIRASSGELRGNHQEISE